MKKYIIPVVEINETETFEMMALSLQQGTADGSDVLSREDVDIWGEEEDF